MFVGQDGAVATRAQRLESMKSGTTKIESLTYDEITVRSNPEGTGALLIARGTVKGTSMGKPVDGQVRISTVWTKTKDGWRQVNTHVTNIPKGDDKKSDDKAAVDMSTSKDAAPPDDSPKR
jgi:ketosteroid isomerase-like protein